jgi:Ni,Fe-hydrogenase III large subunit
VFKALFGELSPIETHRGWPRVAVDNVIWRGIGEALREAKIDLLAEWADVDTVHCALYEPKTRQVCVASLPVSAGKAQSLAVFHAPASRLERAISDLFGITLTGLPDSRPWLDHGNWPVQAPLGGGGLPFTPWRPYRFLEALGPSLHQIPVGPVHAGIIEPGHFRFTASGESVVRLEERLGYVHRGVEKLLAGAPIERAADIVARVSGDSTVAYSFAFARAVELAVDFAPSTRAVWLRAIMAELERIANHLGDFGAICNDAAFSMLHAECGILRELTLRACDHAFGHRLMMDRIVPGGVQVDLTRPGIDGIFSLTRELRDRFAELVELYENTASLKDRTVGTGAVAEALAVEYAAGGYVGRASGRAFDAREALSYPPYDVLPIPLALRRDGDVDARVWVRILEIQNSVAWLESALESLPSGGVSSPLVVDRHSTVEATAMVEGFRGDVLCHVRIGADMRIERCHLRDPSWFQWPLLESAIYGNIVADFPICNKSFNCSYAGHDL